MQVKDFSCSYRVQKASVRFTAQRITFSENLKLKCTIYTSSGRKGREDLL